MRFCLGEVGVKNRSEITALFRSHSFLTGYPLRCCCLKNLTPQGRHRVLIVVPKRKVRLATDRHRIKRRIAEAYRLHRHLLQAPTGLLIGYFYTGPVSSFAALQERVAESFMLMNQMCRQRS